MKTTDFYDSKFWLYFFTITMLIGAVPGIGLCFLLDFLNLMPVNPNPNFPNPSVIMIIFFSGLTTEGLIAILSTWGIWKYLQKRKRR